MDDFSFRPYIFSVFSKYFIIRTYIEKNEILHVWNAYGRIIVRSYAFLILYTTFKKLTGYVESTSGETSSFLYVFKAVGKGVYCLLGLSFF